MIRTVHTAATTVGLLALLTLTACSGGGAASTARTADVATGTPTHTASPSPVEHIDDTWTFDYQGAKGTFKLTGNESDPSVLAVEQARQTVNGEAVTLVPVEVDNTAGTEAINMYGLTLVTLDGQQIESSDVADSFLVWRDAAGDDTDKYNALVDVENKYAQFFLQPGAKGTALVAFAEAPRSAARVYVMPAGGLDQIEASATPTGS